MLSFTVGVSNWEHREMTLVRLIAEDMKEGWRLPTRREFWETVRAFLFVNATMVAIFWLIMAAAYYGG
jgi:hypothetical protein